MNQKSLHPDIVNQLDNLYLKAKLIVEGFEYFEFTKLLLFNY